MKPFFTAFFVLFALKLSAQQSFNSDFQKASKSKDTIQQQKVLKNWEAAQPGDAELYVAYFNYYVNRSRTELLTLNSEPNEKEALILKDSTGKLAGYLSSEIYYNKLINTAYKYIDEGIGKYPKRLDMRFGKIYMLGQEKKYKKFTEEIIATINYAESINCGWTWTNNEDLKDPKNFMLDAVQDYVVQLYNAGDEYAENMGEISEAVLKIYPEHVQSLSNLSISYMLQGNYEKAIEPLLKAEKIAPKDYIVLGNIAHAYNQSGDKQNAIKYYKLTAKYGDKDAKELANQKLLELEK